MATAAPRPQKITTEKPASSGQAPDQDDNVKLLIALGRALSAHTKTPTLVQAVGVENMNQ
jgi:hypothetical protein